MACYPRGHALQDQVFALREEWDGLIQVTVGVYEARHSCQARSIYELLCISQKASYGRHPVALNTYGTLERWLAASVDDSRILYEQIKLVYVVSPEKQLCCIFLNRSTSHIAVGLRGVWFRSPSHAISGVLRETNHHFPSSDRITSTDR